MAQDTPRYVVTYPTPYFGRYYRKLCGINTTRGVSIFTEMREEHKSFNTLEDAQVHIETLIKDDHRVYDRYYGWEVIYRKRIPKNPEKCYGRELEREDMRVLERSDITVSVEGI